MRRTVLSGAGMARPETSAVAARLLSEQQVLDLTIEEPPIEDVIELVFAQEAT